MNHIVEHLEPGRPARPGQLILERRARILSRLNPGWQNCRSMLDIGCGNGAQTVYFTGNDRRVIGVDIIPINSTEKAVHPGSFDFIRADASALPFSNATFDLVVSFEVLEHTPDDLAVVKEIKRVIRPGGSLFLSVPNKWWVFESHGAVVPGLNFLPWHRIPLVSWLPEKLHTKIARARIYTLNKALALVKESGMLPVRWGFITAPLDVLSDSMLRRWLRKTVFCADTTNIPFLAVNLFIYAKTPE